MGVVHRDIKPGNLMLDDGGNLWVTDFGLAKLETAVELTMSGDLLGTLRYMSPEQALARHGLVDHRTDVYSLGATFYELLTLRPAVRGDSKADILRHLAFEEPVALRKLDRAIPSELETITLKCLAKNPAERYATAGELAADLRRFVEEQPIKAKPPRLRERAANWSRRHRYLVRSAVTIVVVSVLALAISTYLVWQKSVQVHTALESESRERRRAEANLQTACDAVLQMLVELGDERLAGIPRAEEVRRKVLQDALKFYQRLLQEQSNDPVAQHETALAYDSVGRIQNELGQNPEAIMAYREGIHLLEPLFAATPDDLDVRHNLAGCLCNLGNALCQSGRETEAVPVYRRAAEIQEGLVAQFPDNADYREYLVNIYIGLGVSESPVDPRKGRGHYERAVDQARQLVERFPKEVDYRKQLASAQGEVASALDDEGRPAEAEALHGQALRTLESLTAEFPDSADYRRRAAGFTYNFGQHLDRAGRFDESEKQYDASRRHCERLAEEFPHTPDYRQQLAHACENRGQALLRLHRWGEAEAMLDRAVTLGEQLVQELPPTANYRESLGNNQAQLAWLRATCPDPSFRDFPAALRLATTGVANAPNSAGAHNALGVAQFRNGNWAAAVTEVRKSMAMDDERDMAPNWFVLAIAHWKLDDRDQARKANSQGVEAMDEGDTDHTGLHELRAEASALLGLGPVETATPVAKPAKK
jgi:tetratricopeptide (TPR) repeat protein